MKLAILSFVLALGAFGQSGTISAALEPSLSRGVGASAAAGVDISPASSVSLRFGTGDTLLAGFSTSLARITVNRFDLRISGDVQAGLIGGRGGVLAGLSFPFWSAGPWSLSAGAHLVKPAGVTLYPTVYVSVLRSWGR